MLSVHAFEMMPRIYGPAIESIRALKPKAIVMFEPIEEIWPLTPRHLVSRLRVRTLDRVRGLYKGIASLGTVVEKRLVGYATNPLNETTLLVVETRQ